METEERATILKTLENYLASRYPDSQHTLFIEFLTTDTAGTALASCSFGVCRGDEFLIGILLLKGDKIQAMEDTELVERQAQQALQQYIVDKEATIKSLGQIEYYFFEHGLQASCPFTLYCPQGEVHGELSIHGPCVTIVPTEATGTLNLSNFPVYTDDPFLPDLKLRRDLEPLVTTLVDR